MRLDLLLALFFIPSLLATAPAKAADEKPAAGGTMTTNRTWDILKAPETTPTLEGYRAVFLEAAERLGDWTIYVGGLNVDGAMLRKVAEAKEGEPYLRVVREMLMKPVDVVDFAYFLDDVLNAGEQGLRGQMVWVSNSRARKSGIFLHPDDVFKKKPRVYGTDGKPLNIDKPQLPSAVPAAKDGEILGPNWTARFKNPSGRNGRLAALGEESKHKYDERIQSILKQLEDQGALVSLNSTTRDRRRGYLMWGAFMLSRKKTKTEVEKALKKLERLNKEWKLNIPIQWRHPEGWQANIEAAREMADTYSVVYATERGARYSNHYGGVAADFTGTGLPRSLTLKAPNGKTKTFDLSHPEESRDINLSPQIIEWIEKNFNMRKLRSDYPHWNDALAKK